MEILDPSTGELIYQSPVTPQAQSMVGATAQGVGGAYGADPGGPFMRSMAHFPTATASMGWNALRTQNTILGGGRDLSWRNGRPKPPRHSPNRWATNSKGVTTKRLTGKPGLQPRRPSPMTITSSVANNNPLNPRSWARLEGSYAVAGRTPTALFDRSAMNSYQGYSPFQFLAAGGNQLASKIARSSSSVATRMQGAGLITSGMAEELAAGGNVGFFSHGAYGRLTTAAGLGGRLSDKAAGNIRNVLKTDPAFYKAFNKGFDRVSLGPVQELTKASTDDLAHGLASLGRGTVSQYASGYSMGATGKTVSYEQFKTLKEANRLSYFTGNAKATRHLALGGVQPGERMGLKGFVEGVGKAYQGTGTRIGGKAIPKGMAGAARFAGVSGARLATLAAPGLNVAMTAWMAYDIANMGMELMSGIPDFIADTQRSYEGQIRKPIFGMGFQDNQVAATSRSRGVMAIQNSRLNARSVLGAEASSVAAHFG